MIVDAPFGRLGALNCWEPVQPLMKMTMYAQHEEVHVASWPSLSIYRDTAYALGRCDWSSTGKRRIMTEINQSPNEQAESANPGAESGAMHYGRTDLVDD